MHSLYLTALDYEQDGFTVAAMRGIRAIMAHLDEDASLGFAKQIVDDFIETPTVKRFVVQHEDLNKLGEAIIEAAGYHQGAAEFEIDPETLELPHPGDPHPDDDEDAGVFSAEAYKTALVLMNGQTNPSSAYVAAYQLARSTGDVEFYAEVQAVLLETFQVNFGAGGPQVHVFGG